MRRTTILMACMIIGFPLLVNAQTLPKGFELQEVIRISQTYRYIPNLNFNMRYAYSDSATPGTLLDTITGTYQLHDGKFRYVLDSTEVIQGNNYAVSVHYDQKVISVSNPSPFPDMMQVSLMDSVSNRLHIDSMSLVNVSDTERIFKVSYKAGEPYAGYQFNYDPTTYLMREIRYYIHDVPADMMDARTGTSLVKITFSNYTTSVVDESVFLESRFIYRDGTVFYPKTDYSTFTIINNVYIAE